MGEAALEISFKGLLKLSFKGLLKSRHGDERVFGPGIAHDAADFLFGLLPVRLTPA
jgi:hypothetical protein